MAERHECMFGVSTKMALPVILVDFLLQVCWETTSYLGHGEEGAADVVVGPEHDATQYQVGNSTKRDPNL